MDGSPNESAGWLPGRMPYVPNNYNDGANNTFFAHHLQAQQQHFQQSALSNYPLLSPEQPSPFQSSHGHMMQHSSSQSSEGANMPLPQGTWNQFSDAYPLSPHTTPFDSPALVSRYNSINNIDMGAFTRPYQNGVGQFRAQAQYTEEQPQMPHSLDTSARVVSNNTNAVQARAAMSIADNAPVRQSGNASINSQNTPAPHTFTKGNQQQPSAFNWADHPPLPMWNGAPLYPQVPNGSRFNPQIIANIPRGLSAPFTAALTRQQNVETTRTSNVNSQASPLIAPIMQRRSSTNSQQARTTAASPSSSSSRSRNQNSPARVPTSNVMNGNRVAPVTQRSATTNSQQYYPTSQLPLATVSSIYPQNPAPPRSDLDLGCGDMRVSAIQQSPAGTGTINPAAVLSSPNLPRNSNQQTIHHTTAPAVILTSPRPTTSVQAGATNLQNRQDQKRRAEEAPCGEAQAQKRQATPRSNVQLGPSQYKTPNRTYRSLVAKPIEDDGSAMTNPMAVLREEELSFQKEIERGQATVDATRERERRLKRKKELIKDPSALFRHYTEFLEHYPLGLGERKSQYHTRLIANQRIPMDKESDLGLAIMYAKDNWEMYMEYPKDYSRALEAAKARLGK